MAVVFDVNTNDVIELTVALKKMHRSAFPVAVRSTLNELAFMTKQKQLIPTAQKKVIVRNKTFFRRFSGVNKATGFNVDSMRSEVGFTKNKATKGMKQQEIGGSLKAKSSIPVPFS